MCLIILACQAHPKYPLIIAANRDEFIVRSTREAHWWPEANNLFAGKDLVAGGTWMGVTTNGKFSAVTNVREPQFRQPTPRSRGELPLHYLKKELPNEQFSDLLAATREQYQGYNLLYGKSDELYYFSNRGAQPPRRLKTGIYGLSNAQLDTPWPKVTTAKERLKRLMSQPDITSENLLNVLSSTEIVADDHLPETGVSLDWERKLSAIRISGSEYRTRSSTVVLYDRHGKIDFHERTFLANTQSDVKISIQR